MVAEHTYLVTLYTPNGGGNFLSGCVRIPAKYYEDDEFLNLVRREAHELLRQAKGDVTHIHGGFVITNIIDVTRLKPIKEE